jgi:hypothetical protein
MKICSNPKCGKEINSSVLNCPQCSSILIEEYKDGYKGIWMSPDIVISRFEGIVKRYGFEDAIKNNKFKQEREGWVSGVWALGITTQINKEIWVEIETVEQTPDTHVFYFETINGNNHRYVFDVEVVDWEEHTQNLMDIIIKKSRKSYASNFTLLIYGRHPGKTVNMEQIYGEVQKLKVPFWQIWILGGGDNNSYTIFQLFGGKNEIEFNLEILRNKFRKQIPFSKFLMRGTGTEIKNLGSIYLPLPQKNN